MGEGLCCLVQRYCEIKDIRETTSKELAQCLNMTKSSVAWALHQLGWEPVKIRKNMPFYKWKRNGVFVDFSGRAKSYATKRLRSILIKRSDEE